MKPFELAYLSLAPLLTPLHRIVRSRLTELAKSFPQRPRILDVGGRKSHYTIGVPGDITISDLPRESDVQKMLHLGINSAIVNQTRARRSNVEDVVYDDMSHSKLPDATFGCVVSVEVLEHVEEDDAFVRHVSRVLKPGGVFLMTTPNGDSVKHDNPDHKRHYTRHQLRELLERHFRSVDIEYAILGGRYRRWGLKSWSPRNPVTTVKSMVGNFINYRESMGGEVKEQKSGTRHLIAVARNGGL